MDKDTFEKLTTLHIDVAELKTDMKWVKDHLSAQKVNILSLIGSVLALAASVFWRG